MALTDKEFEAGMARVKRINKNAWDYLSKFEPCTWSKSRFSELPKCDNTTNNNCESFNSRVVEARSQSIITMLEDLRGHIMETMARHKKELVAYAGTIAPVQQSRLEKEKSEANLWTPHSAGDNDRNLYEVRRRPHKVSVDLGARTCTCRKFQLTRIPCKHAIAAIQDKNLRPEDYVHEWLSMTYYNATYDYHVKPIPSVEHWEKSQYLAPLPPIYKRPIGRPTKKRKQDKQPAPPGKYKVKRKYGPVTCQFCKQEGHNSRTCPIKLSQLEADWMEEDQRAQEENWEETMDQAHEEYLAAAEEENLTQVHPHTQEENNVPDTTPQPHPSTEPQRSQQRLPKKSKAAAAKKTSSSTIANNKGATQVRPQAPPPGSNASVAQNRTAAAAPFKAPKRLQKSAPGSKPPAPQRVKLPTIRTTIPVNPTPPLMRPAAPSTTVTRPTVSLETMGAASRATTSRFMKFMPTPTLVQQPHSGPNASVLNATAADNKPK